MYNNYVQEYTEWKERKKLIDLRNKLVPCYQNNDGSIFYVEPLFYTYLQALKKLHPDYYKKFLTKMDEITKKEKRVAFVGDEDNILLNLDNDFIYLTVTDIASLVGLILDDKSNRESDWKD